MAGVVPGMPLIAFKVLGRDGSGPLDGIYKGYAEIIARQARGEKIVAINLSLGSPVMDADSLKVECDWVKKLASYGTTVVAAAGEKGEGGGALGDKSLSLGEGLQHRFFASVLLLSVIGTPGRLPPVPSLNHT